MRLPWFKEKKIKPLTGPLREAGYFAASLIQREKTLNYFPFLVSLSLSHSLLFLKWSPTMTMDQRRRLSTVLKRKTNFWKYYFDYVNIKICNSFLSLHSDLFSKMDNHCYELLKKVVSFYVSIRFKSHSLEQNELLKKNRLRTLLSKSILQQGL